LVSSIKPLKSLKSPNVKSKSNTSPQISSFLAAMSSQNAERLNPSMSSPILFSRKLSRVEQYSSKMAV